MRIVNLEENYFDYVNAHPDYKIVVYGAGNVAKTNYKLLGHVDYFCD